MSEEIIISLLGSSVLIAFITLVGNIITFFLNRKAQKEDRELSKKDSIKEINAKLDTVIKDQGNITSKVDALSFDIANVTDGQMILLKKEIEREASKCISKGKIKIKTREEIHVMHDVYHNKLHGNGGLDSIMIDIDELPLDIDEK